MAEDLLKRAIDEIRARIKELEPQVHEHERLQSALASLEGQEAPKRRGSTRGKVQRARRKQAKRAGRGERREQLLRALGEHPGMRPSEAARAIGIQPSQVHSLTR